MRLRYLQLQNYPPINDLKVAFAGGSPLGRDSAIRFVVGVNGSGKSNLLRAVAEVFLALADERLPPFPVSLFYELGRRGQPDHHTFLIDCPGSKSEASIWVSQDFYWPDDTSAEYFQKSINLMRACITGEDIEGFSPLVPKGTWPQQPGIAMPKAVLAYTTGDLRPWRSVWSRNQDGQGLLESGEGDALLNDERPAGWTVLQEAGIQTSSRDEGGATPNAIERGNVEGNIFRRPLLLDPTLLKCALLAVALPQAFVELDDSPKHPETDAAMNGTLRSDQKKNALQELLERGGWHHLVTVGFRSRLEPDNWDQKICEAAHDWWLCAGEVVAEPHPVEAHRTLLFDLKGTFDPQGQTFLSAAGNDLEACDNQGEALWALLGGAKVATTFELFTRLLELNRSGLFDDILLRLRRQPAPDVDSEGSLQDIGVLRYEELSDGEQMFLGRMALLHLLPGQHDSLLLLDEPETHFNDLWKRDIVSVVDEALAATSAEVWIATHAALMLTDALKEELVVLERTSANGCVGPTQSSIRVLDAETHTFGATGDHPLRDIFGAPDTVGRRASRLLEVLIAAASLSSEMDAAWRFGEPIKEDLLIKILMLASQTENGLAVDNVAAELRGITQLAQHFGAGTPLTMKAVLEAFIKQTGPGYFQVELKRAWRRLQESGHAA